MIDLYGVWRGTYRVHQAQRTNNSVVVQYTMRGGWLVKAGLMNPLL